MRGGYTTVIPKSYVFRLCPYRNVTQAQLRPREWQRLEDNEERRGRGAVAAGGGGGGGAALGDAVLLGVFSGWAAKRNASLLPAVAPAPAGVGDAVQRYEFGSACPGGPGGGGRVVLVALACGAAPSLVDVAEDGLCEYRMTLVTPFACTARDAAAARAAAAAWEEEEPL